MDEPIAPAGAGGGCARILVVDDDPEGADLVRTLLHRTGYDDVHVVTDPRRAMDDVERLLPDLVLLDWHMPDVTGEDVLGELAADPRWSSLPAIVLTGDADARRRAFELGAADFLPKPFDHVEAALRIRNVLRLHRLTRRLAADNRELEHRVRQRTEELQRLNDELRRMDAVRRDFVAMASHEMRTPLTVVLGFIEHWSRIADGLDRRELTAAHRNARRLQHLINNLLIASRVEGRDGGHRLDTVRMRRMLEAAVDAGGIEVEVTVSCPAGLTIRADRDLLTLVVVNLLSNAERYGRPPVTVEAVARDGLVSVRVSDAGPGVEPSFEPLLFTRFTQASSGDRRSAKGTGLGLWLSRRVAELHGGRLEYAPRPGGGATFTLTVPQQGIDAPLGASPRG